MVATTNRKGEPRVGDGRRNNKGNPGNKGGCPAPGPYKPEMCQKLIEYMRGGGIFGGFGATLDPPLSRSTVSSWVAQHPEFKAAREVCESISYHRLNEQIEGFISGEITGNFYALRLKVHNVMGWNTTDRVQITGDASGAPLQMHNMSSEELEQRYRELLQKAQGA